MFDLTHAPKRDRPKLGESLPIEPSNLVEAFLLIHALFWYYSMALIKIKADQRDDVPAPRRHGSVPSRSRRPP